MTADGGIDVDESGERRIPWILWPFYAIWRLLTFILELTGRLVCAVLGLAMMMGGVALTLTVAGAPVGIPLAALGLLLLARALF